MNWIRLERIDDDLQYHFRVCCNGTEFDLELHPADVLKFVTELGNAAAATVGDQCHRNN